MNSTSKLRVLVIGREPNLFDENSEAFKRIREYAELFEELHIVSGERERQKPRRYGNLFLWPASSRFFPFRLWKVWLLGRRVAKKFRPQVIDAQDTGEWGLIAFRISLSAGIPLRLQIHTDIMSPFYRRTSWKEFMRYHIAKFLIPHADCIRVVSERIKSSLSQAKPFLRSRLSLGQVTRKSDFLKEVRLPKIVVLPIFTDISKFQNAAKDPQTEERFKDYDFKMISVGRFVDKEKNFSMLIKMMRDFIKICPKALLVLVGDGPDRENYKLQITNYKLEKNVTIEPWRDDLPSFYKSFDLFLISSNYEGWGRAAIEAMACGLPVIMTDVGLAGEVLLDGENGYVVPVGDTGAMLGAIKKLYEDPEIRQRFAAAGQSTARSLRPATKEEYLTLYKESISRCSF